MLNHGPFVTGCGTGILGTIVDMTAPLLISANIDLTGQILTLIYNENLNESSVSEIAQFTLNNAGYGTLNSIDVIDNTVRITLSGYVVSGEVITLDYDVPLLNPIQDLFENNAVALSSQTVTNNSIVEIVAPSFVDFAIQTSAAGATRTPDLSAISLQAGDILVAQCQNRSTSTVATMTEPASQGWDAFRDDSNNILLNNAQAGFSEYWFWKRWGSGDTDDTTPTFAWSSAGNVNSVAIVVLRNCKSAGKPYIINPVRLQHAAAATITAANVTDPGGYDWSKSLTLWGFHFLDDNTPNGLSRGQQIFANNLSTAAAMAAAYEVGVNASTEETSYNESTNGNDACRVMTLVFEGAPQVADPPFSLSLLTTTGYAESRINNVAFQQSSVITDPVSRSGVIWQYAACYDRSNGGGSPASRLQFGKRSRPVAEPDNWSSWTTLLAPLGLNPTNSAGDEHLSVSLQVDEDGRLMALWNAHWSEFQYAFFLGTGPGDIDVNTSTVMGGSTVNALPSGLPADCSYPKLFKMADGSICLTARQGASGSGTQGLWEHDSSDDTWNEISDSMIDGGGNWSPYMQHVHVNPTTGVVHFSFCVAEGQNTTTYRDICYFSATRSGGAGGAWTFKSIDGTTRTLPITDASHFVALDVALNRGMQVHQGLTCTAADVPAITTYYAKDGAVDRTGGSNRYLITRSAGAWVRNLIHEVHPEWNLINGNGSHDDPSSPTGEYSQVGNGCLMHDEVTGAIHCVFRSNYLTGSSGIPCLMVTSSFAAPYDTWTEPSILADTPIGDSSPTHDINGWDYFVQASFMLTLCDSATVGQYPGGAASNVFIADCILPTE